jgi:hypothetical protein
MRTIGLLLCVLGISTLAWSQGTQVSQIAGTVQDQTGASVPGAQVIVTNTDTGVPHQVESSTNGAYTVTSLPPGPYKLEVTKTGFANYQQIGIVLQVNTNPEINVTLKVGAASEQVQVEATAAQVETHQTGVGQVIDQQSVVELPLNGRQVTQLVTLSGASSVYTPASAGQSALSNKNYPTSVAFSIGGGQGGQTLFMLDGGNNMDVVSNVGLPMPFPDALQEFKVETSSLPANYGSQPGGVVNVVTRSGTNSFHGVAFEFLRNYDMNAKNFFATATDGLKRNQFGGDLGGPIRKNKLFFFGGYQGTYESSVPAANEMNVATAATIAGNFQPMMQTCYNNKQLAAPFVNNQIPASSISPFATNLLKYLPVSSNPCGTLFFGIPSSDHENQFVAKVDYQLSDTQSLFVRYFITKYEHAPVFENNAASGGPGLLTMSNNSTSVGLNDTVQTAVVGHTWTISSSMVNSIRAGFTRAANIRTTLDTIPTTEQLGVNATQVVAGYGFTSVSGFMTPECQNCSPGPWISTDYQLSDELNMIRGKHQIIVGAQLINERLNAFGNFSVNGNTSFSGTFTGNALADFMLGESSSFSQNTGQIADERLWVPSFYAQDNYRLNPHLTINLGIRWDPYLSPTKSVPEVSIFDPTWYAEGIHSTKFTNAPVGTLFDGDPGYPGNHYFEGRWSEWAPRIGVVFDPRGKGLETVRAGYGIFYGSTPLFEQGGSSAPYAYPVSIPNPVGGALNPYKGSTYGTNPFPLPNPIPGNIAFPLFGGGLGNFLLHPKPTYMEQWNLALQKQLKGNWLVSASYLGNRTVHLEYPQPENPVAYISGNCVAGQYGLTKAGPCSSSGNENYRRVLYLQNPATAQDYAALSPFGDSANASYNAMLISAQHRFASNYQFMANYTWSHCLTESEIGLNGAGFNQYVYNRAADKGNCLSDHRQVMNLTLFATMPTLPNKWMQRLLGHWQESTIFTAQSGSYSTITDGVDNSLTGISDRPNYTGQSVSVANQTISSWFNNQAFVDAPVNASCPSYGCLGNVGRQTVRGPGGWDTDIALIRGFPVTEHTHLDFRAEAFNLFNHPWFGNPSTSLNSPTFGQITSTLSPTNQRILQLALKYVF